jgi:hypothetical protein
MKTNVMYGLKILLTYPLNAARQQGDVVDHIRQRALIGRQPVSLLAVEQRPTFW